MELTCTSNEQREPDKCRLQCVFHGSQDTITNEDHANAIGRNGGLENCIVETGKGFYTESEAAWTLEQHEDQHRRNFVCYENNPTDARQKETDVSPTVLERWGTGGNQTPYVQVSAISENIIGRAPKNGGNHFGVSEDVAYTENTSGVQGVACYPIDIRNATRDPEKKDAVNRQGVGIGKEGDAAMTLSAAFEQGVAAMQSDRFFVRRLTPVECERLMGFPDNHTRISWNGKPAEECPDGPRYKACGNAFCVNVVEWIGRRIEEFDA
jgi:site-specific DNA-cytosine methylase